jgi:hypothetical protein
MDLNDQQPMRELRRVLPLATHWTPEGNVRIDVRLRFIVPKTGNFNAEVEFFDPEGDSLRGPSSIRLSTTEDDEADAFLWYMREIAEASWAAIRERRAAEN